MRPVLIGLALTACRADPPASSSTADTGPATSTSPTTRPTTATVTVDVPGTVFGYDDLVLWVSAPDGALVRSVEVAEMPAVVPDVPIGGSVTFGIALYGHYSLQTIGDVRDGDVLRPFGSWGGPANGAVRVTVPSVPDGADPLIDALTTCIGWGGFPVPFDHAGDTEAHCYTAGSPASAWVQARPSYPLPLAVAWLTDVAPSGSELTFAFPADPWISDYGRTAVSYTHAGDPADIAVSAWSTRGPLWTSTHVASDPDLTDGETLTATVAADSAFHDHLIAGVRATDLPRESTVYVSTATVAERGQTAQTSVDPSEVPPLADLAVDPVARTAALAVPDGWSCAGRGPNVAKIGVSVSGYDRSVSWSLAGPYAEALAFPEPPPEIADLLAQGEYRWSWAEVASVEGGFDALRQSDLLDEDWVRFLAARPTGETLCVSQVDPAS